MHNASAPADFPPAIQALFSELKREFEAEAWESPIPRPTTPEVIIRHYRVSAFEPNWQTNRCWFKCDELEQRVHAFLNQIPPDFGVGALVDFPIEHKRLRRDMGRAEYWVVPKGHPIEMVARSAYKASLATLQRQHYDTEKSDNDMGFKVSETYAESGNFLDAAALKGQHRNVVIYNVGQHQFDGDHGPETHLTIYVQTATQPPTQLPKPIRLSNAKARILAEMCGDDTDTWIGRQIVIFPEAYNFKGRQGWSINIAGQPPGANEPSVFDAPQQQQNAPQPAATPPAAPADPAPQPATPPPSPQVVAAPQAVPAPAAVPGASESDPTGAFEEDPDLDQIPW